MRGILKQPVSPAVYDLDRNENEEDDWTEKWLRPFDPRSGGIDEDAAREGENERASEKEEEAERR